MAVHLYPAGRAIRRPHVERKTAELFYIHYKRTAGICLLDKLNNYMRTSRGGNHWEFTNAGV